MLCEANPTAVATRADELFAHHRDRIFRSTDRLFARLMVVQFIGGVLAALVISPRTWAGASSSVHPHVWAAVGLGGLIAGVPIAFAHLLPGRFLTRCVIASAQMLESALLIHLTGGRIETHFHVFGSLAFVAFYRDWRVFIPATLVVGGDHLLRGLFWPESVYGVLSASPWRSLEHAAWVAFENTILIRSCTRGVREMHAIAEKQAELEATNALVEERVRQRTSELSNQTLVLEQEICERRRAEESLREMNLAMTNATPGISRLDTAGCFVKANGAYAGMLGCEPDQLVGAHWKTTVHPDDHARGVEAHEHSLRDGKAEFEALAVRSDGTTFHKHVVMVKIAGPNGETLGHHCFMRDISERKRAEAEREETHRKLVDLSRQAGMAEVATGVLHNVGNVLNSVNVSASLVAGKVRDSQVSALAGVAALVHQHSDDLGPFLTTHEKGRLVPAFLTKLSEHLVTEQATIVEELHLLTKNIEHIKEIVSMQQTYAKVSGVVETLRLADLVEDALRISSAALTRHGVLVVRAFEEVPAFAVDKQKVVQILVNLISNAKHAVDDGGAVEKVITVRLGTSAASDGCARVEVIDNGVGIAAENLTRIFAHGFTTRKQGHGFGLHSAALAAKTMGGSLAARSGGTGRGATFMLELPLQSAEVKR